ncbi:hypothetical protein NDI39_30110 [Microcoleus sp. ZQ-A2]|nr:hypothetical protein [Microcoleus sp. FACHB-1]
MQVGTVKLTALLQYLVRFDTSFLYGKRAYLEKIGSGKQRIRLNNLMFKPT